MAPVLGIKTSSSSSEGTSGSISVSGQSGSPGTSVASFSSVSDLTDMGESSEFEEHAFSIITQDTVSWVSGKRVVDSFVLVLPAREFR
ncbi:hypothetical protein HKD37_09G025478 [Glycine soja]